MVLLVSFIVERRGWDDMETIGRIPFGEAYCGRSSKALIAHLAVLDDLPLQAFTH
jgi:hypothetical protein